MSSWEEDLPLASAWVVHEQRRATGQNLSAAQWMALQQIACEFSTVEEFWTSFEHLPPPSTVFYDGKSSKRVGVPPDARTIESFSIFRAGVLPEWDDPSNKTGGEWYARRSLRPHELDAAPQHDKGAVRHLALSEELRAARQLHQLQRLRQQLELGGREGLGDALVHAQLGHEVLHAAVHDAGAAAPG